MFALLTFLISLFSACILAVRGQTSYDNDFVDPTYIIAGNFTNNTEAAQQTVVTWANELASQGPWSVVNKTVLAPSGDIHDYLSWAPYSWPNCTGVGNTTELTPQQIWVTCPYVTLDGQFNPDARTINDVGNFQTLSDAVLYNAMAWAIQGKEATSIYSRNAASFLATWFLNNATQMNPNLNYAQMVRGPNATTGDHEGVLDLKCMAKIVSGILILRKGNSSDWTPDLDEKMNTWTQQYIMWLETAPLAIQESKATNNHGTYYYNQLAALKTLVNDPTGALNVTQTYFKTLYLAQINANGEQPLEAVRTRPYHYRAYNLAAMITNARLERYLDPTSNVWNLTTTQGATIQTALNFAMTIDPSASGEADHTTELYPNVAAVAATYGDPDGKYLAFVNKGEPDFASTEAYDLWNQPFAKNEGVLSSNGGNATSQSGAQTSTQSSSSARSAAYHVEQSWTMLTLNTILASGLVYLL